MPAFFLTLITAVLASLGGRDQILIAQMSARLGNHPGLLVTGWLVTAVTTTVAAIGGGLIASMLPEAAKSMFVAIALVLAAAELALLREPQQMQEPTRSLGAAALALAWHQATDGVRFLVVAIAAATAAPPLAAAGGFAGSAAALALGWWLGTRMLRDWPIAILRRCVALLLFGVGVFLGLSARGIV